MYKLNMMDHHNSDKGKNIWTLYGGDSQNGPFAAHGVFQEPKSFPRPEERRV